MVVTGWELCEAQGGSGGVVSLFARRRCLQSAPWQTICYDEAGLRGRIEKERGKGGRRHCLWCAQPWKAAQRDWVGRSGQTRQDSIQSSPLVSLSGERGSFRGRWRGVLGHERRQPRKPAGDSLRGPFLFRRVYPPQASKLWCSHCHCLSFLRAIIASNHSSLMCLLLVRDGHKF